MVAKKLSSANAAYVPPSGRPARGCPASAPRERLHVVSLIAPRRPPRPPGNSSTQCTPGSLGHADTAGLIDATNSSGDTLTINAIDLAQHQGIKLVGAYVTPGAGAAGVWATFPPPAAPVSAYLDWSKRIPAVGAHVPPGETISITLGIEPTTTTGSSTSDVEVLYHDGGSRFELRTTWP